MSALLTSIVVIQVVSALTIIGLVLMQHGKGADMGAAFGSGASGSLFGASGSSNFLSKSTGFAAAIFFCATLALAFLGSRTAGEDGGVMGNLPAVGASAPASGIPADVPGAVGAEQNSAVPPRGAPSAGDQSSDIPK
jgi:preprotein translocase subunit SecG